MKAESQNFQERFESYGNYCNSCGRKKNRRTSMNFSEAVAIPADDIEIK